MTGARARGRKGPAAWWIGTGLVAVAAATLAQEAPLEPAAEDPMSPERVEAFVDGFFAGSLPGSGVAGATVAVVRGSDVLLTKGYGLADVENGIAVDADTMFRIGSITKPFVWITAMQLVEEGNLDLTTDVNEYLRALQVPETFPEPVTFADLMTHSAGFEDDVLGLFQHEPESMRPLGEVLGDSLPRRVRPPGFVAYSNHATALGALVVQDVTGVPWDDLVQDRILRPLGMNHTTTRQPVPEELRPKLSKGYRWIGGAFVEQGFEYVPLGPAGGTSASASDMARFLSAQLQDGRLGERQILAPQTARRLRSDLLQAGPGVPAIAHGLFPQGNPRLGGLGHGGDTMWFHSILVIYRDQEIGLFASFNSEIGGTLRNRFVEAFEERFLPVEAVDTLGPSASAAERVEQVTGSYRSARYSHSTLFKLVALLGTFRVSGVEGRPGVLQTSQSSSDRWVEQDPYVFHSETDDRVLSFTVAEDGSVSHASMSSVPYFAFERVGWIASFSVQATVALVACGLFALTLAGPLVRRLFRRRKELMLAHRRPALPGWARLASRGAAACLLGYVVVLVTSLSDASMIVFGLPSMLKWGLWLPILAVPLTVALLAGVAQAWKDRLGSLFSRLHLSAVLVAAVLFLAQLHTWNQLGFRF